MKGLKITNGPPVEYHLVYRLFPRTVMTLRSDGFYHPDGRERGCLVMSISMGQRMYHRVDELMRFKCE